jgi:environmental stress-induced protein Ves
MTLHFFERAQLPASPWKNGGGVTREIACHPPSANMQNFDWRISIAHIASDGDFSLFAGVDRVITLLEGGGVHLSSANGSVMHALDTPLQPFAFSGDAAVHGRLLNGDCHDFNVMTRRGVYQAEVRVLRQHETLLPAPAGLLMAIRGEWQVQNTDTGTNTTTATATAQDHTLIPQTGLWWHDDTLAWPCRCADSDPDAALLTVRFTPHPR